MFGEQTTDSVKLRVALLPIFDVLPFYVAEEKGYFHAPGIEIKAVSVGSALERDQLLQSGEIDGMLNEMITTANFNRKKIQAKIVGIARYPKSGAPLFRILASPKSGIDSPEDLAGIPIGVSVNTIIEYVADRILTAKGLSPDQIRKQSVPIIPERFQLLMQGRLRAAVLPDPIAFSAVQAGAVEIIEDSAYGNYSVSVLTFSKKALEQKGAAVRHFLHAWDRAAADINADPDSVRELVLKKIRVPGNIRDTFKIPQFPRAAVPDAGQWADVMEWMVSKGLLYSPVSFEESVTEEFLPVK